jgi:YD repeat-containing protein
VLIKPPSGPPTTQSFDANGNLTLQNAAGALSTFAWDGENRMVGYQNPSGAVGTLLYSADGLRKAADVQDGSAVEAWRFVWDGQNVLRKESSAPGVGNDIIRTTDYPGYWGGLASLFDSIGGSQILAIDPQGNVRLVLQGGTLAGRGAYTGFGEVLSDPGVPFAYVGLFGYLWDNPFYYVRARYYDPVTGRWYSRDAMVDDVAPLPSGSRLSARSYWLAPGEVAAAAGALYAYAANRPQFSNDPSGYQAAVYDELKEINRPCCEHCFADIRLNYGPTYNHYCHHLYAHCTMCCVLARSFGPQCANWAQHKQIVDNGQDSQRFAAMNRGRWHGCNAGKAIAANRSLDGVLCSAACLQPKIGFPWPKCPGDSICSSEPFRVFGVTCAGYLRSPSPFGWPGGTCSKE